MGIPKFFRWAGDRYRAILSGIIGDEESCPFIDNFYLDMNGIIHHCSHGDESASNKSFEEILNAVCGAVHRMVVDVVKPQRLIFLAIDGVAPRAKLNQQRARRFRSAHERSRQLAYARLRGISANETFDSNCITPGTEFMVRLGQGIRDFIVRMMSSHPLWSVVEVIFSGCDVPGEGEHKIISYIRDQKAEGNFPPNLRHCIYGADADMIMLALATHEPFTIILREIFQVPNRNEQKLKTANNTEAVVNKKMQFIRIHTLRQLLIGEFSEDLESGSFDGERFLDDFVLLTFLVGNDFLPHLPGIDIGDNAFDIIFDAYKTTYYSEPGYLVSNGKIDYNRLELIFNLIGTVEAVVYQEKEVARATRGLRTSRQTSNASNTSSNSDSFQSNHNNHNRRNGGGAASPVPPVPVLTPEEYRVLYYQNKLNLSLSPSLVPTAEEIAEDQKQLKPIVKHYLEGLSWCLAYYTTGCISWSWYYPYHYGLFLQDMCNLQAIGDEIQFELGMPLTPFQQLLACLPPGSSELLPGPYRLIMTDEKSPIKDMYPLEFMTDLNGKKNDYEAVVLLPFIETNLLLQAEALFCSDQSVLIEAERDRNQFGSVWHYRYRHGQLYITNDAVNYQPGSVFIPALIEGTLESLPGFPPLSQLQVGTVFGQTVYFSRKASNKAIRRQQRREFREQKDKTTAEANGNTAVARPSNPQRHDKSNRKHGRRQRQQEVGTFGAAAHQGAFPMPGWTMLPSLSAYDATIGYDEAAITVDDQENKNDGESALDRVSGSWVKISFVLDSNSDQFLAALGLQIQQRVPAFTALCNVDQAHGYAQYSTKPLQVQEDVTMIMDALQRTADIFAATRGKLTAQAVYLPMDQGRVAILFEDVSHLEQVEQFMYDHLLTKGAEIASESTEAAAAVETGSNGLINPQQPLMASTTERQNADIHLFERMVTLGYYSAADGLAFAQWLSAELSKYAEQFPLFLAPTLEVVGVDADGDMINYQLPLFVRND